MEHDGRHRRPDEYETAIREQVTMNVPQYREAQRRAISHFAETVEKAHMALQAELSKLDDMFYEPQDRVVAREYTER